MEKNILYHYTKVETLFKIINNLYINEYIMLRANFFMNMNDPIDCRYLINEISSLTMNEEEQNQRENVIHNVITNAGLPYFISLSTKGDDLPMWKMYGDNGHGVVIGFDRKEIANSCKNYQNRGKKTDKSVAKYCFCKLLKCNYWDKNDIKSKFVDKYFREYDGRITFNNPKNEINPTEIAMISCLIKSPYYQYECEERILYLYSSTNKTAPDYINFYVPINSIRIIKVGPCLDLDYIKTIVPECLKDRVVKSSIIYTDKPQYVRPNTFIT